MDDKLGENVISWRFTSRDRPEENGLLESHIYRTWQGVDANSEAADLPNGHPFRDRTWFYNWDHSEYHKNLLVTDQPPSPYTKFNNVLSPQIHDLHPWGQLGIICRPRATKRKNNSPGELRVFVGYLPSTHRSHTFKMYSLTTHKWVATCDVHKWLPMTLGTYLNLPRHARPAPSLSPPTPKPKQRTSRHKKKKKKKPKNHH